MKRILAIILCLAMMAVVPACKPDNIQYPAEIIDPDEQELLEPETEESGAGEEQQKEETPTDTTKEEEPADKQTEEEPAADETEEKTEETDEQTEAETEEEGEPIAAPQNPLAAEDFIPSAATASTLTPSGIVKPSNEVSILKNRTISFYTADETPAFTYTDEQGKTVTEWDWMEAYADESGFLVEYSVKPAAVSVKAQRVALYAGKKLSLVQLHSSDLAAGLTLCSSAEALLDLENDSYGVSKTVLSQSSHKLLAPIGNIDTLWYNTALVGEQDPALLQESGKWTVEEFQKLCTVGAQNHIVPLLMESALPWATLSGKSPITLKDGKLDTNINSEDSKSVWSALQKMNKEIPTFLKDEDLSYTLKDGTVLMEYTSLPEKAEEMTLGFAPLPALTAEGESTVTFSGTFFALPKYETGESARLAALTFAESWCNRYTEARAAQLQSLGIKGAAYQQYADLAEQKGMLILGSHTIEEMVAPYLKGLTDDKVNMANAYSNVITKLYAYVATQNLYY